MTKKIPRPLDSYTDEQIETLMAYVGLFLNHKKKEQVIGEFTPTDKAGLAACIMAISYVSERLLQIAKSDPEFTLILDLFRLSKQNGTIHPDLQKIYIQRKEAVLQNLQQISEKLKLDILGEQSSNYLNLLQSSKYDKQRLCESIWNDAFESCTDAKLVSRYKKLLSDIDFLHLDFLFKFSDDILHVQVTSFDPIEYFAFLVYKPEHRLLIEMYDPYWDKFPLKWASHLSVAELKTLYDMFIAGEDLSTFYESRFEKEGVDAIRTLANDPVTRTPLGVDQEGFREAINQALSCYENKHFMTFLYAVLPVIEGILWKYSVYLNAIGVAQIYKNLTDSESLINSSGSVITDASIGDLLKRTAFQNYFDREFIDYFCDELYTERNPVLHGKDFGFATPENAIKKLATLEYLLTVMKNKVEDKILDSFNKLSPGSIEKLLEAFGVQGKS